MATTYSDIHGELIKYVKDGTSYRLFPKTYGSDVSVSRAKNAKVPSSVTSVQTLVDVFGTLAFKSEIDTGDFKSGVVTTSTTITSAGYIADARAIKTLTDNVNKLNSNSVNVTLSASKWGSTAPYSYEITLPKAATATTKVDIGYKPDSTSAQVQALMKAALGGGKINGTVLTIYAYGKKPTIDLPVTVNMRGELS